MGISLIPALFLARHSGAVAGASNGLILGRQKLHMPKPRMRRLLRALKPLGFDLAQEQVTQSDGFAEALLAALGYPVLDAMDFTDKEGARHIHNLNDPVPAALHERFDVVIDGGTTEHIFCLATALDSCHAMLKPGGIFLSFVAGDGWFGHGFFQIGPDVPWRYWHHARGYEMLEVSLVPRKRPETVIPVPDPTSHRRGGELALTGPHMIMIAARKPLEQRTYVVPTQSHYVRSGNAGSSG